MSFQPLNVDFLINSDEVKAASESVKKSLMAIGLSAEDAEKKINDKIDATLQRHALKTLPLVQQQGVKTQRVWNGLGNSISQLSREIPAFAVSAQTGFLAISNNLPILADEIQRLRDKNAALVASGKKGIPVWRLIIKNLLSWQTALSIGVALLTVYGKDIVEWIGTLFKGAKALDVLKTRQEALNKAFESSTYRKVISDLFELTSTINLAKKGVISKEVALKKYNETLGDVVGETDDLLVAEKNVVSKAPAYIKAMLFKVAAMEAAKDAAVKLAESQKEINKINDEIDVAEQRKKQQQEAERKRDIERAKQGSTGATVTDAYGARSENAAAQTQSYINNLNEDINKIEKKRDTVVTKSQSIVDKLLEQSAKIANAAGLDIFGEREEEDDDNNTPKLTKHQSLLDKIAAIDAEYTRKSFTKDEEELKALEDKFAKIRKLVERFNADPKNKANLIDLTSFNNLEKKATSDLKFRQETDKLKTELTQAKKLYEDYEKFKTTFGAAAAEKEFADRIGKAKTYYDFLKTKEKENATAFTAVEDKTATGGQTERVLLLNDALKLATTEQQKLFNEQLAELLNYQEKRRLLIENHQKLIAALEAKGQGDKIAQAQANHKEALDDLDDAHIKKLRSYKALQQGIVGLSKEQAKTVIANAKALLDKVDISEDLKAKIKKQIKALENALDEDTLRTIFHYTQALGEFGTALQDLGGALGSSDVANAGALLTGIASGMDDLFAVLEAESDKEVIAAGIGAAISLISVLTRAAAERKKAAEEYYLNVIGFQNEYNLALAEQQRLQTELSDNVFLTDYVGIIKDNVAGIHTANEELQNSIDDLIKKGEAISGQRNAIDWGNVGAGAGAGAATGAAIGSIVPVIGTAVGAVVGAIGGAIAGLFGGKKKKDTTTAILEEYPELIKESANGLKEVNVELAESLIANDLVKGETKEILQNIVDWQKALEDARAKIKEVIGELAGGLGDDLRTALVDAFVAGEDAAIAMGDTVSNVLEDVLSNFIFNQIFQQAFDDLQAQMAASFDVGGDNNWVDDFGRFFSNASALTDDFNQAMADAQAEADSFGFDIFNNDANAERGIVGATRAAMTEDTANELTGLWRGSFDLQKRHYQKVEEYMSRENKSTAVFSSILLQMEATKTNTFNTVEELKKVNQKLVEFKNSTSAGSTRDLGVN